jgi:hypothetical protein
MQVALMDPLREVPHGEMLEVVRVAARMQTRDQARAERERLRQELVRAAEEAGLTEGYLRRAALQVRGERGRRRRWAALGAVACMAWGLCSLRTAHAPVAPPASVYVQAAPDAAWVTTTPAPQVEAVPPPTERIYADDIRAPVSASGEYVVVPESTPAPPAPTQVPDAEELIRRKSEEIYRNQVERVETYPGGALIFERAPEAPAQPGENASGTGP